MSYILDALRKADAQRERDPARGIHAQPLRATAGQPRARGAYGPALWAAAAVALAALALSVWYVYRDRGGSAPARQERVAIATRAPESGASLARIQTAPVVGNSGTAPPGAAPVPVQAPAPAPAIEPPAPAGQPFTTPAGTSRITSLPMMRGGPQSPVFPAPVAPGAAQPGSPPAAPTTARGLAATPMASPATPAPTALPRTPAISAPVPAPPPTAPVAGLPSDAPKLVLSGGVYSLNPAQRMLIVNGQVFNEGSEVGSGVVLEEIRARTVVLRFRGSRYTVSY